MFLSRSLTLGLLGVALVLLLDISAALTRPRHACAPPAPVRIADLAPVPVSVVDVARGVAPTELVALIRLRAGERVVAVDETPVASELMAGALIASLPRGSGSYVDLTVAGRDGDRRVLVLLH